mgnify:CR=1 FL=1
MTQYFRDAGRALLTNGYLIIPIRPGEKRPALSAWQNARLGASDLSHYPDHGVGILCGQGAQPVVGIDIDISHPTIGPAITEWCRKVLGWAPERVGAAPRTMLVYRAAEAGWAKGNSVSFFDPADPTKPSGKRNEQQIEVLGLGQQFVAYHIHPDTGMPYEWTDLFGGLEYVKASDLPVINETQVESLFMELDRLVRATPGLEAVAAPMSAPLSMSDDDFLLGISTKTDTSLEKARELLGWLTNAVGVDYDTWVTVGMAFHHEFDGSAGALAAWNEWSSSSPKHIEGECERKWRSFGKGGKQISLRWLIKIANQARRDQESIERREALETIKARIEGAVDQFALTESVAKEVRELLPNIPALRAEVFGHFQHKFKSLTGTNLPIADVRRLLVDYRSAHVVKQRRPLTEFGNAERMLDQFGTGLRYVPELATWYTWTGVYWRKAMDVQIECLAKETIKALGNEAGEHAEDAAEFYAFCSISQQAKMVRNMVVLAASDPRVLIEAKELDKHKHLLGVANGMVDLRTGNFLQPDPNAYVTRICACNYNPSAKAPLFEQTVRDALMDDAELVAFFWRVLGYIIQGDPTEDVMIMPHGNGSNGKSTIYGAFRRMLGGYAKSADASSFVSDGKGGSSAGGAREDLVRLMGARLVFVNEPDENGELREGAVKSMTGGDSIPARGLYSKVSVEIVPTWVTVMPTNHKPIIKGNDNGIWRRIILQAFDRNFDSDPTITKDPQREQRLMAEFEGILLLTIRAGIEYRNRGLNPPASVRAARDAYRNDMDLLSEWIDSCCVVDPGKSATMLDLWQSWEQFAKNRGNQNYVRSANGLGRRLESRFPSKKATNGIRIRVGICVKSDFEALVDQGVAQVAH